MNEKNTLAFCICMQH